MVDTGADGARFAILRVMTAPDAPQKTQAQYWLVLAGLAVVAGAIFAIDLTFPQGYAVWALYLPICVYVAWRDRPREALASAAVATLLIVAGEIVSASNGSLTTALFSRLLEALTIWLAVGLTITRRRASQTMQLALDKSRSAHDRLSGIIINNTEDAIVCIDKDQTIALFNGGAERVFGYRADEVLGRNLKLLLPSRAADAHPGFVRDFAASPVQSRRMGERGTVAGRRRDGSEFPAEVSISKFSTAEGVTYTAVLRDITARMKADELLREREQRLRLALSAGHMGTFQVDEASGMARLDEAAQRLLNLPEHFPTPQFFEQIHAGDREQVRATIDAAMRRGGEFSFDFRIQLPDGGIRWVAVHAIAELDAHGKPLGRSGVNYDITERKEMQQALEARVVERTASLREEVTRREEAQADLLRSQKLQAVGELAGGMAHDFNNLLTVITGNLELLGLRQLDDKARDLLRRADDAATMGARLSSRLLAIGRRQRLQPVSLDLNEVARSMTDVLKRTLGGSIDIQSEFAPDLWPARADMSEVENAILNLAINARDAMPTGGKLIVQTMNKALGPDDVAGEAGLNPGDYVMLSVTDTGVGIPPEHLARVFEPYFTTKESGRGTGLGLSTIYGFAKQSGGHLAIYSEIGKGTSVRLYLPRSEGAADVVPQAPAALEQAAGETVLVVEDNPDVRDVTVKRLDMLGYRVVTAENGPAAIAVLQGDRKIDLVFSDVVMPGGMSGFDLVNWVRKNKSAIKVLLTSGFTGEVAQNGEREAARDVEVLRKPYAVADLARAVREALS